MKISVTVLGEFERNYRTNIEKVGYRWLESLQDRLSLVGIVAGLEVRNKMSKEITYNDNKVIIGFA